jgi:predicted O-methyltransferase YrrM
LLLFILFNHYQFGIIYITIWIQKKNQKKKKEFTDNINFDYINYERNIITDKIIKKAGWQLSSEAPYFINGIIRKFKPKKCLEIGVANGGSSILILNAIKDIDDSFLVSMDLNTQMYLRSNLKTGFRVKKYFPELSIKWRLFTGDLPHKFLVKLNETFDFLFLDTAHLAPGELLNFIEVLPFLKEKAIIILHDILWHFYTKLKIHPSSVFFVFIF